MPVQTHLEEYIMSWHRDRARSRMLVPYDTSLMRQVQPDSWLNSGKLEEYISITISSQGKGRVGTNLAPKHQPSSLSLIFLAIFTSRERGISYPV